MISLATALLGGLVGALLSLIVTFMVQERRRRGEVFLKVVYWMEQMYRTMEVFMVQRDFRSDEKKQTLFDTEVYQQAKMRLREIAGADTIRAEVAITFGEGDDLSLLNGVQGLIREILENAWTRPDVTTAWIRTQMDKVQEGRTKLEGRLREKAKAPWFLRCL